MSNIYVGQFKDVLKAYYKKQKELNAMIVENNKRYSEEYAEAENKKVAEMKTQAYNDAKAMVLELYSGIRGLLANANFLNVESLTADRIFFQENSGFSLAPEEVNAYIERYKDNYTMLRLIKDWIAKNDRPTNDHPISKYANINITMPSDILQAYKKFGEGALSVIEKIHDDGLIMNNPIEIEAYGDEKFGHKLYEIVGSGMELCNYKNKRIPESAKHTFDDVKLTMADANYYAS